MHLPKLIEYGFQRFADSIFARWPRAVPPTSRLRQCKLIAHRGDHRKFSLAENTLKAFQASADSGVWGIELDIRWTHDMVPVVAHDPDLLRVHGDQRSIQDLSHSELQDRFPSIPALNDVVAKFGSRLHLMIEIKEQSWPALRHQNRILHHVLSPLVPAEDYHLLCMHPRPLRGLAFAPPQAKAAIAYHWPDGFSRQALNHQWGGLCGHYLLMHREVLQKHKRSGQQVGTGFVDSPNCLCREIERGVHWIFSNRAAELQTWINLKTAS